jgi:hypothetical protein
MQGRLFSRIRTCKVGYSPELEHARYGYSPELEHARYGYSPAL